MTITAIMPQKRNPNRSSVFVDGAFAFGMHGDELARYALTPGMAITREKLDYLLEQVVWVNARDTALRYLSNRARTYQEMLKRLEAEEYPDEIINRVMALMIQYRYIDDRQFARDYAESRLRHGRYGVNRIKQELRMKGITGELLEEALQNADEAYGQQRAAREWLARKQPDTQDPAQRKKCIDGLLRRGFTYAVAKEALAQFEGEFDE